MASFSPCKSCHCLNMINECFFKWKLIISVIKITWPRALDCRSCNYLIKIKVTTKQHYQGELAADLSCRTNVVNQMDQNMFDTEPKKWHIIMISDEWKSGIISQLYNLSRILFFLPYRATLLEKARSSPVVLMTCSDFSGFVMDNHLNRHTYGFIQSRLVPFYLHLGSACAFFNLTIYAVYHPSDLLDDREAFQVCCFVPHQHIG